jgi:calcineurin-like phosphoesterase family protein
MRFASRVVVFSAFTACAVWISSDALTSQAPAQRLVAIGDVHGAGDALVSILQAADLIDAERRWNGGRSRFVQTGDFTDRGPTVRDAMDLLMRLEDEAKRAGGRAEILLGNHEGMNILHDLRDVSSDTFRSFADDESESRRSKAFMTHATIARRSGQELNRTDWLRDHPLGFIEYIDAMGPSGRYGRWLRTRKVVTKIDDSVFMHAGIRPDLTMSIDDINRTVEREIRAFDDAVASLLKADVIAPFFTLQEIVSAVGAELTRISALINEKKEIPPEVTQEYVSRLQRMAVIDKWSLIAGDGPLWFRGYATLPDDAQPQIEGLLNRLGAARFVVGHSPRLPGNVQVRFGNRVFLIDTGMLSTYFKGGRASALEISGTSITAIYTDEKQQLVK